MSRVKGGEGNFVSGASKKTTNRRRKRRPDRKKVIHYEVLIRGRKETGSYTESGKTRNTPTTISRANMESHKKRKAIGGGGDRGYGERELGLSKTPGVDLEKGTKKWVGLSHVTLALGHGCEIGRAEGFRPT